MFVERSQNGWVVHAPAKINLALEVLGRQPDGFHQVETLLVPVRLFDTLTYTPSPEPLRFSVEPSATVDAALLQENQDHNLVVRALRDLANHAGVQPTGNWRLTKRIPMEAGLGGGSSDAAAALVLSNQAWGLNLPLEQLGPIAANLGTDVPFFLTPGPAIGTNRGEQLQSVPNMPRSPLVIVQPPEGLATPAVFNALGFERGAKVAGAGGRCSRLAGLMGAGCSAAAWRPYVRNCLQAAATKLSAWMERIARVMDEMPVVAHQMTGSGSAYFGVCRTWREARRLAQALRGGPWQSVIATSTCV
ncbi:4-(cytidine 5'-diphospho)-2-C-methyl-D-erythritol kinase [Aeoliella sp. SH292]|uniref:4-(cytidine 5'-diphospho)-2-C-methyl-D-erythritol kinase n=1 Tax=Aeoliella sp. SH292 TaxID=3454464 RepID=UPI003F9EA55E